MSDDFRQKFAMGLRPFLPGPLIVPTEEELNEFRESDGT